MSSLWKSQFTLSVSKTIDKTNEMIWWQVRFGFDEWSYFGSIKLKFQFRLCCIYVRFCDENQLWWLWFPILTMLFNFNGDLNTFWRILKSLKQLGTRSVGLP